MVNQVHIVGEARHHGGALLSGKCQWIGEDTRFGSSHISHADNIGSSQVSESSEFFKQVENTFDQMESISRDFLTNDRQSDLFPYVQQLELSSLENFLIHNKVNPLQSEKGLENVARTESLRGSICSSSNHSLKSLNVSTSYESGNDVLNTHVVAMPVNSKSINAFKGLCNVGNFINYNVGLETPLQVQSSKQLGSTTSTYTSLNNLLRIEHQLSCDLDMLGCPSFLHSSISSLNSGSDELCHFGASLSSSCATLSEISKDCLQTDKLVGFQSSSFSCLSMGNKLKSISANDAHCVSGIQDSYVTPPHVVLHEQSFLLDAQKSPSIFVSEESLLYCKDSLSNSPIIQIDLTQEKDSAGFICQVECAFPELPNRTSDETATGTGTVDSNMNGADGNNDLLERMMFDPSANALIQDWWDDSMLLAENLPNLGATASETVMEPANHESLSVGASGLLPKSVFKQLLGANDNVDGDVNTTAACSPVAVSTRPLGGGASGIELPKFALQDCLTAYKAQVPPLTFHSSSYTSENAPNGYSKAIPVSPLNLSLDDSCSLSTANSQVSLLKKPDGVKVVKRRARPGESTRPRPKDRQQIQDRVKELREIVPNSAKCSIDALLDRTIKHMLFLHSVTKYAEKIKQTDEPKMIDKESGVVLKDNSSAGNNGATWAYEVAGKTMVCPITVEDLEPPGQMLVEMLCEERGFFLEIAENIRGFGLTILKGLMEFRDSKIWARFLVEANRDVTRMDIFLSLVQLLQQNSPNQLADNLTKVIGNGVTSLVDYQQSPMPIPVGLADRLQ